MKNTTILEKLGLTSNEQEVYLSLVKSGPLTISELSEKTGLHRPLIYKTLPNLRESGLVTVSPKGKRKVYSAESPEKLKFLVENLSQEVGNIIPQLKSVYQSQEKRPIVKFLEGKKGIMSVFEDLVMSLKRGDVYYRYSSAKDAARGLTYLPANYQKLRTQKQIERFVITSESRAKEKKPELTLAVRAVPTQYDLFDYDITQVIYGDKVAFIDYNTETAIVVENKVIAEFQKKIFKLLYNKL